MHVLSFFLADCYACPFFLSFRHSLLSALRVMQWYQGVTDTSTNSLRAIVIGGSPVKIRMLIREQYASQEHPAEDFLEIPFLPIDGLPDLESKPRSLFEIRAASNPTPSRLAGYAVPVLSLPVLSLPSYRFQCPSYRFWCRDCT